MGQLGEIIRRDTPTYLSGNNGAHGGVGFPSGQRPLVHYAIVAFRNMLAMYFDSPWVFFFQESFINDQRLKLLLLNASDTMSDGKRAI